jgi:hypothetical protein
MDRMFPGRRKGLGAVYRFFPPVEATIGTFPGFGEKDPQEVFRDVATGAGIGFEAGRIALRFPIKASPGYLLSGLVEIPGFQQVLVISLFNFGEEIGHD